MGAFSGDRIVGTGILSSLLKRSIQCELDPDLLSGASPSALEKETLQFMAAIIKEISPHSVLELGSGFSTRFFNQILDSSAVLYSFENSEYYLEKTIEGINPRVNIDYLLAPLKPYFFRGKAFLTYDPAAFKQIPSATKLDIVLIDGPLGFRFGREAALYLATEFISPATLIILDDANRLPEQNAIDAWKRVWKGKVFIEQFPTFKKGLAILQISDPGAMNRTPFGLFEIVKSWKRLPRQLKDAPRFN